MANEKTNEMSNEKEIPTNNKISIILYFMFLHLLRRAPKKRPPKKRIEAQEFIFY